MGQAKRRGTMNERVNNAEERKKKQIPTVIECNDCGAEISKIEALESRPLIGVTGAYVGKCTVCNSSTIGMTGDPETVKYYMQIFANSLGANSSDLKLQAIEVQTN